MLDDDDELGRSAQGEAEEADFRAGTEVLPRQRVASETKVQIALDAMLGYKDKGKIAEDYGVSMSSVNLWLRQFRSSLPGIFDRAAGKPPVDESDQREVVCVREFEVRIERKLHDLSKQLQSLRRMLEANS